MVCFIEKKSIFDQSVLQKALFALDEGDIKFNL